MTNYCKYAYAKIKKNAPVSTGYVDFFLTLNSASKLVSLGKWDVKEITESVAAYMAVKKYVSPALFGNDDVLLIDACSGKFPRTGLLFAYNSRWKVVCVDPNIKKEYLNTPITVLKDSFWRVPESLVEQYNKVIIVGCHTHLQIKDAPLGMILQFNPSMCFIMPCCERYTFDEQWIRYEDKYVLSPANKCYVYLKGGGVRYE